MYATMGVVIFENKHYNGLTAPMCVPLAAMDPKTDNIKLNLTLHFIVYSSAVN